MFLAAGLTLPPVQRLQFDAEDLKNMYANISHTPSQYREILEKFVTRDYSAISKRLSSSFRLVEYKLLTTPSRPTFTDLVGDNVEAYVTVYKPVSPTTARQQDRKVFEAAVDDVALGLSRLRVSSHWLPSKGQLALLPIWETGYHLKHASSSYVTLVFQKEAGNLRISKVITIGKY